MKTNCSFWTKIRTQYAKRVWLTGRTHNPPSMTASNTQDRERCSKPYSKTSMASMTL